MRPSDEKKSVQRLEPRVADWGTLMMLEVVWVPDPARRLYRARKKRLK